MINNPTLKEGGKVTVSNLEELAPGPHGQLGQPLAGFVSHWNNNRTDCIGLFLPACLECLPCSTANTAIEIDWFLVVPL